MIEKDIDLLEQGVLSTESMDRLRAMQPWQSPRYCRSDLGNAFLFADFFGDRARYMKQKNCWYVYDGKIWRMDENGLEAKALIKAFTQLLTYYCDSIPDAALRDAMLAQLKRWHSRRGRKEILEDARDIFPLSPEMMDANPMFLNCQNGTLDLEIGALHAHHPGDLQSRMCGASYLRGVKSERWEQFVLEVMSRGGGQLSMDDLDEAKCKARWLQRMLGYALTGDTRLECMFILYGASTRNGKSTLTETMLQLMGSYGMTMRPESLGLRPGGSGGAPTEDLARLDGARFVCASEPDKHLQLSASLVKTMTGNDTITARALYQNSIEYKPQFKLFLNTNHLPSAGDVTLFDSGRVHLLPFERHFEPEEQDRTLKDQLTRSINLSGILNWCLAGLQELRADGFSLGETPETARRCLTSFRMENDHTALFAQECLVSAPGQAVKSADVYRAYVNWCARSGFRSESILAFRKGLARSWRLGKARIGGSAPTSVVFDCALAADAQPM